MSPYHRAAVANSQAMRYAPLPPPAPLPSVPHERLLTSRDPYYGHQHFATMHARYLRHVLSVKDVVLNNQGQRSVSLSLFIATALHRTPILNSKTSIAALLLLSRVTSKHPFIAGYATGHQLFTAAYKVASKALHGQTYQDWSVVAQNMYSEEQITELENILITLLGDSLVLNWVMISSFECLLLRDYGEEKKSYPDLYSDAVLFPASVTVENSSSYDPKLGLSLRASAEVIPAAFSQKGLAESIADLQRQLCGPYKQQTSIKEHTIHHISHHGPPICAAV